MKRIAGWILFTLVVLFVLVYYVPNIVRCRSYGLPLTYCASIAYL